MAWAAVERHLAPTSNTSLTRFDAIIVLGTPADDDGNPTPYQLASVTEAVHEYSRGIAPRLILTGGAAHNRFVEARVMARTAEAQGIPSPPSLSRESHGYHRKRLLLRPHHEGPRMGLRGGRFIGISPSPYGDDIQGLLWNCVAHARRRSHRPPPGEPESALDR